MEILAIIPARGGSKRIPGKNIKELGGKPLIAYSIEQAKNSKFIGRVLVSTDSKEIADIAKKYGAEVPFLRPEEISGDFSTDFEVFDHALKWLKENERYEPDILVQLRPTSPLREASDVDAAIELLINHPEADSVRTVIEAYPSPYKMYTINAEGYIDSLLKISDVSEGNNLPDQALPLVYRHIGTADVIWSKTIVDKHKLSGDKILPLVLKSAHSGINTPDDWNYYEYLISKR